MGKVLSVLMSVVIAVGIAPVGTASQAATEADAPESYLVNAYPDAASETTSSVQGLFDAATTGQAEASVQAGAASVGTVVGNASAPVASQNGYDYSVTPPAQLSEFALYYNSDNIEYYVEDKYHTVTAAEGYVTLVAPEGKKFSSFSFQSRIGGQAVPRVFAYAQEADLNGDSAGQEITLGAESILVRSSIYYWRHYGTLLPDDAHYLKILMPATTEDGAGWAVQLYNLGFNVVDEEVPLYGEDGRITDGFGADVDDLSVTDPFLVEMTGVGLTGGSSRTDGNAVARSSDLEGDAYFTVQAPPGFKIADFTASTVAIESEPPLSFECAGDLDDTFLKVPTPEWTTYKESQANWVFHDYALTRLPANTRYVRVRMPAALATWSMYVDGFTMHVAREGTAVDAMPEEEYAALNAAVEPDPHATSGTVTSDELYLTYRDDAYVAGFANLTVNLQPYAYNSETKSYEARSALVVDDPGEVASLTLGAPDNSTMQSVTLDVASWNTPGNVALSLHPVDAQGNGLGAIVPQVALKGAVQSVEVELPDGTSQVRMQLDARNATNFKGNDFRLTAYSFDWAGTPDNALQGEKAYALTLGTAQEGETFKGWGIRPSSNGVSEARGASEGEIKNAILRDLGVNMCSIDLYCGFDPETKALTSAGEDEMQTLLEQLRAVRFYGEDYLLRVQSPPAELKSNGRSSGVNDDGSPSVLLEEYEDEFCDYVVLCLQRIQAAGLPLPVSISFTNEPEGAVSWAGCYFTREQYVRVCKALDAALAQAGFGDILLHGPESSSFWSDIMFGSGTATAAQFAAQGATALGDGEFAAAFDVYGFHSYGTLYRKYRPDANASQKPVDVADIRENLGNRELWQTEFTALGDVAEAMQHICRDLRVVGATRWFYWWGYCPDTQERPSEALIIGHNGTYEYTPLYYMLKAVFNGIPAGSQLVDYDLGDVQLADRAAGDNGCNVICNALACRTPDGGSAAILVNDSAWSKTFDVRGLAGKTAAVSVYDASADAVATRTCTVEDGAVSGIELDAGDVLVLSTGDSQDGEREHACGEGDDGESDGGDNSDDSSGGGNSGSGNGGSGSGSDTGNSYKIVQGAGETWSGEGGHTFASDADFSKFVCVLVDGEVLDPACYDAVSGSTRITLHADYLATLAPGKHTATIRSTDGEASTTFTVQQATSGLGGEDGGSGATGNAAGSSNKGRDETNGADGKADSAKNDEAKLKANKGDSGTPSSEASNRPHPAESSHSSGAATGPQTGDALGVLAASLLALATLSAAIAFMAIRRKRKLSDD